MMEPALVVRLFKDFWNPLPLPPNSKQPPPTGWTGNDAPIPDRAQVTEWLAAGAYGNVALRLPLNVIGIDVDAYGDKPGAAAWAALQVDGPWPVTYRLSARYGEDYDGISGIRFYRLPDGFDQSTVWGAHGGIELLRWGHRYAVGPGSIHPNGREYKVIFEGDQGETSLPMPADLPVLSAAHAALLTKDGAPWAHQATESEPGPPRAQMCRRVTGSLSSAVGYISRGEGGRYDRARDDIWELLRLEDEGHAGVPDAIAVLRAAYIDATAADRRASGAPPPEIEFDRAVRDGAAKIAKNPTPEILRGCCGTPDDSRYPTTGQEGIWEPLSLLPGPETPGGTPEAPRGPGDPAWELAVDNAVRREVFQLTVRERARLQIDDAKIAAQWADVPILTAGELAERAPEEIDWRVEGLWPAQGKVLLSAAFKAGKTTLGLNLDRALTTGSPFLGKYETKTPAGALVNMDLEMNQSQLGVWYREADLGSAKDRIQVVCLRGLGRMLDFRNDRTRAHWATRLVDLGCSVLKIDPIGPVLASVGIDENENSQVGEWLGGLDALATEASGLELLVVHHYGHGGRTRGASTLLGWPDALWSLERKESEDDVLDIKPRTFGALGRDVDEPARPLGYDASDRRLWVIDQEAVQTAFEQEVQIAIELLTEQGLVGREYRDAYREAARLKGLHTGARAAEAARAEVERRAG